MAAAECDDFATVVGRYVDALTRQKALRKEAAELRDRIADHERVIVAYMENKSLDICRINKDGESGQLAVSQNKTTKGIKRECAITEIATFFDENRMEFQQGNSSTKADELWTRVQGTRETSQRKALRLS